MKTDIIIPVWNQLKFSRDCIESVAKNTLSPHSLIVIDNGSDIQTKRYLESLKEDRNLDIILIRNEQNLGFVKAANQGIEKSSAGYICLLNNDTRVTSGWLTEMVKVAEKREDIGIVNSNSNTLAWKPKRGESLETVAKGLRPYTGEYSELAWASGFCMLIKRKVIQEVGLFDEIYGMGTFEDADFSKRAQQLGYFCVCATAAYVYHREKRSFIKFKEFDQDFERNRQIFHAKWGRPQRILYVLTKHNPAYAERIAEESLKLARQGNYIWVFLSSRIDFPIPYKEKALKDKNRQKNNRHSNIGIYSLPRFFSNLVIFWRLVKRKKKFEKVYVDDANYARTLNYLKPFHKAEVVLIHACKH